MAFVNAAETSICGHTGAGWTGTLRLDANSAQSTDATVWQDTAPSPTVVTIGTYQSVNKSSTAITLYCFKAVESYSAFGSYVGHSSGPVINPGIKPETLFVKSSSTGGSSYEWNGLYSEANEDVNGDFNGVQWSTTAAESSGNTVDFLSNGAKIRLGGIGFNDSGVTYVYLAWGTPSGPNKSGTPAKAR
jgi:hypothetical protein